MDKVDAFLEKVQEDRHISSYDIAEELGIDHETVLTHLKKAGYTKKLNTWVPHALIGKKSNELYLEQQLAKKIMDKFGSLLPTDDETQARSKEKRPTNRVVDFARAKTCRDDAKAPDDRDKKLAGGKRRKGVKGGRYRRKRVSEKLLFCGPNINPPVADVTASSAPARAAVRVCGLSLSLWNVNIVKGFTAADSILFMRNLDIPGLIRTWLYDATASAPNHKINRTKKFTPCKARQTMTHVRRRRPNKGFPNHPKRVSPPRVRPRSQFMTPPRRYDLASPGTELMVTFDFEA
ncbi:hypothetical protein EVAR_47531_1 [Eumeta japonica]|uniref:Histone-lysine N-methyltransferase SETMAR n=1 Tax=Eumeta variegata TaxID=151549 RepID=A0A4C1XQ99_EUMVA|nr:hypothetical protein EVAR_47531_1 [Eumeta japonica]